MQLWCPTCPPHCGWPSLLSGCCHQFLHPASGNFTHSIKFGSNIAAAKNNNCCSPSLRSTGSQQNKLEHSWHTSLQNGEKSQQFKSYYKLVLKVWPLKKQASMRTHGQQEVLQTSRCFSLNALLHLIPSHLHVCVKHWKRSKPVTPNCTCTWFCPLCNSETGLQTFPQVLCTAVSKDGDKSLLISAKLLFSGFEEDLQQQRHNAHLIQK